MRGRLLELNAWGCISMIIIHNLIRIIIINNNNNNKIIIIMIFSI